MKRRRVQIMNECPDDDLVYTGEIDISNGNTVVYIREYDTMYPFEGTLIKAEYGFWNKDGTERGVKDVENINIDKALVVSNKNMGGDPLHGTVKYLRLTFAGDAVVTIPEHGGVKEMKGHVKNAVYGANDTWAEVTLPDNAIEADNKYLGGDPLKGVKKSLKITYGTGAATKSTEATKVNVSDK